MARRAFYSFHYLPDSWRASQVRNMGVVDGNTPLSDNDWETVKRGGDTAIRKWIEDQLSGRGCAVVLVGAQTAGRKWITYELQRSWDLKKGVVGVRIHNLKDIQGNQAYPGSDPFLYVWHGATNLSSIVKLYDPPYTDSKQVYGYINDHLANWVDESITIRGKY